MLLALPVLLAVQGCWLQTGWGPERRGFNDLETGVTAANVADLEVRWTAQVAGEAHEALIDRGAAFVRGDGELVALRLDDGTERWAEPVVEAAGGAIAEGRLRLPVGCSVRSFDLDTGASEVAGVGPEPPEGFRWSCESGDVVAVGSRAIVPWLFAVPPIPASPICRLGIWTYGPGITALDAATMTEDWQHAEVSSGCSTGGPFPPSSPAPYGPVSADATFALVPQGTMLHGVALDCAEAACPVAWSVDLGARAVGPAVALETGDLAVPVADGRIVVVGGTSHQVAWVADTGAALAQPLAADATTIFAVAEDGSLMAFPAGGCGAETCEADWTAGLSSPASARPSIAGDVVYVGSADGTVAAFPAAGCGAATCDAAWSGSTPSEVTGAPAIFSGTVVVGSSDGTVTAFALPGA